MTWSLISRAQALAPSFSHLLLRFYADIDDKAITRAASAFKSLPPTPAHAHQKSSHPPKESGFEGMDSLRALQVATMLLIPLKLLRKPQGKPQMGGACAPATSERQHTATEQNQHFHCAGRKNATSSSSSSFPAKQNCLC